MQGKKCKTRYITLERK